MQKIKLLLCNFWRSALSAGGNRILELICAIPALNSCPVQVASFLLSVANVLAWFCGSPELLQVLCFGWDIKQVLVTHAHSTFCKTRTQANVTSQTPVWIIPFLPAYIPPTSFLLVWYSLLVVNQSSKLVMQISSPRTKSANDILLTHPKKVLV